jgi:histidine ammonia-lyase
MEELRFDLGGQGVLSLTGRDLTVNDVVAVARHRRRVEIAPAARNRIRCCRAMVEVLLSRDEIVYGLTTGFGRLRDVVIPPEQTKTLQFNLIRSHACGVGDPFPEDVVRAAILLRINTLCRGNSGIRIETVEQLVRMLNDDLYPLIPQKGSVGASGDLAPLSHLGLVLIGDPEGRFYPRARRRDPVSVVRRAVFEDFAPLPATSEELEACAAREGWSFRPVELEAKEGLALNNGTQVMTAVGCLTLYDAFFTLRFAELAAAMSVEAQRGMREGLDPKIHQVRSHSFQEDVAARVRAYLDDSQILGFHLNSACLYRARHHFLEALDHLHQVAEELHQARLAPDEAVPQVICAIEEFLERTTLLNPVNFPAYLVSSKVEDLSALPDRVQVDVFNQWLTPVRQGAIEILKQVQGDAFPRVSATNKVRNALIGAIDQLQLAVPDMPMIQDDYSFRCLSQVIACAYRALDHVAEAHRVEINSANDNPLLFPPEPEPGLDLWCVQVEAADEDPAAIYAHWLARSPESIEECRRNVISGGNFHGQPIAVAMDYLSIALAEIASIAERRVAHLVDAHHSRGLPPFLIDSSGLNSGFMLPQYTAAALVSENKVLCHPASIDSIPTCANVEDHVSMGTFAARKAAEVVGNVRTVVAIEVLAAYQGLKFREPLLPGTRLRKVVETLRGKGVERYEDDRVIAPDIRRVEELLGDADFVDCLIPISETD